MAKSFVETINGPQLTVLLQHLKLHLLHVSHRARAGVRIRTGVKERMLTMLPCEAGPDLFTLSVTLSLRDFLQKTFNAQRDVGF